MQKPLAFPKELLLCGRLVNVPGFETLIRLSDLFDVRTDYILGKSNDSSSAKLSDDDIEQLGRWELESVYTDLMKLYLSLDSFGQKS